MRPNGPIIFVYAYVILLVIAAFFRELGNWSAPEGAGVQGTAVLLAYIGFDAISTTAEERKTTQDLPRPRFTGYPHGIKNIYPDGYGDGSEFTVGGRFCIEYVINAYRHPLLP